MFSWTRSSSRIFRDNGNKILPKTLLNFTYTKSVCHITIVHRNMVKIVNTRQKKLTWAMHGPRWPSKAPVCPMEGTNRVVGPWRHPRTMEIHRMTSRAIGNHAWPRLVFVSMVFYMWFQKISIFSNFIYDLLYKMFKIVQKCMIVLKQKSKLIVKIIDRYKIINHWSSIFTLPNICKIYIKPDLTHRVRFWWIEKNELSGLLKVIQKIPLFLFEKLLLSSSSS